MTASHVKDIRVPESLIEAARKWSRAYPKEIEFQEGLFGLLPSRLIFAQAHNQKNEQRRSFREMKTVAEQADYSEYWTENELMETIRLLKELYHY